MSEKVHDVANFKLAVGDNVSRCKLNDVRPLLKRQQQQQPMTEIQVTTAEHVKRFRKGYKIKKVLDSDSNSSTDEYMVQV